METLKNLGIILAVAVSLFKLYKELKDFVLTPPEHHRRFLEHVRKWASKTAIFVTVPLALLVAGFSIWEIIQFGRSDAPVSRRDILLLIASLWNTIAYLGCAVAIPLIAKAIKQRDQRYMAEAQT